MSTKLRSAEYGQHSLLQVVLNYLLFKNLFYFITVQRNVLPEFHTYHPGTVGISHGQDLLGLLHHQGSC